MAEAVPRLDATGAPHAAGPNDVRAWLARMRAWVARLRRRAEPTPGRFEAGSKGSWRGWVASAPLAAPRREYLLYLPRGHRRWRRAPLLVMCHGCRQTPEEFAAATGIEDFADLHGWLVLLPRQAEGANPWRCWNWFDTRTARGAGEAAIVLAQVDAVRRDHRADARRVIVAGLSAGGALAAAIAVRHSARVAGVFVHSGLACGAASGAMAAMGVLQRGPDTDVEAIAAAQRRGQAPPRTLPLCVVHGEDDDIVAPRNAVALVRQFLVLNGHAALAHEDAATGPGRLPPADREAREAAGGRTVITRDWVDARGALVVRHVSVGGLRHAWSGGDPAYPYSDPQPPPATAILARFAAEVAG